LTSNVKPLTPPAALISSMAIIAPLRAEIP
jgi:hypothetical protein